MTIGIYRIFHVESGKSYVGQSVNVERRLNGHLLQLSRGSHCNNHLQSAYSLYGKDSFATEVLESCQKENLTEREQFWMDSYRQSGGLYNLAPAAGSPLGYKHTNHTKLKVSQSLIGNKNCFGKKFTEKTKARMKVAKTGKTHSQKSKENMSKAHRKAVVYNGVMYDSIGAVSLAFGISHTTVRRNILRYNNEEYHYA